MELKSSRARGKVTSRGDGPNYGRRGSEDEGGRAGGPREGRMGTEGAREGKRKNGAARARVEYGNPYSL